MICNEKATMGHIATMLRSKTKPNKERTIVAFPIELQISVHKVPTVQINQCIKKSRRTCSVNSLNGENEIKYAFYAIPSSNLMSVYS